MKKVVLGAKRILSTSMTSRDVAKLVQEKVDVASTLSVDVQAAFGQAQYQYVNDALSSANAGNAAVVNTNNVDVSSIADILSEGDSPGSGVIASVKYDQFASSSLQAENASKISQKTTVTSEINIGGLPDADWTVWAASAKERPMPISYRSAGLWTLFEDDAANKEVAFFDALLHIEGIDLKEDDPNPLLDSLHFGVYDGTGAPISSYSENPEAGYRILLQVGEIPSYDSDNDAASEPEKMPISSSDDTLVTFPSAKYLTGDGTDSLYACCIEVYTDYSDSYDDAGTVKLKLIFAEIDYIGDCNLSEKGTTLDIGQVVPVEGNLETTQCKLRKSHI